MRVISGVIILIMYYKNTAWAAYMPINSNSAFTNTMESYNVSRVLNDAGTGSVNVESYLNGYGPPYYAIANLLVLRPPSTHSSTDHPCRFVTGGNFVYYTFSLVYVFVKYWRPMRKAFGGIITTALKRQSNYTGFNDGNIRMMRNYPEVPEWWYGIVFGFGFLISIVSVTAWVSFLLVLTTAITDTPP
jgi:hypothetical protein